MWYNQKYIPCESARIMILDTYVGIAHRDMGLMFKIAVGSSPVSKIWDLVYFVQAL